MHTQNITSTRSFLSNQNEGSSNAAQHHGPMGVVQQSPPSAPALMEHARMKRRFSTGTAPSTGPFPRRNSLSSSSHKLPEHDHQSPPPTTTILRSRVNASERGSKSLLPEWHHADSFNRERTWSSTSAAARARSPVSSPTYSPESDGCLRTLCLPLFEGRSSTPTSSSFSNFPRRNSPSRHYHISLGTLLQILVATAIVTLVVDAKLREWSTAELLEKTRHEELVILAKMEKLEERSAKLHDTLKKLKEGDENLPLLSGSAQALAEPENASIKNDYIKWKKREMRLQQERKNMQRIIQNEARGKLKEKYGDDVSLYVNMEVDVPGVGVSHIAIELFDETPHANLIWLEEIASHNWDNAQFIVNSHILLATPGHVELAHDKDDKLEFVETPEENSHAKWTVGLTQRADGGVNFYINIDDEASNHETDSCIGKVVGGEGALEHIMTGATKMDSDYLVQPVSIRSTKVSTAPKHFRGY